MLQKYPELGTSCQSSLGRSQADVVKYTLESSVNSEGLQCFHDVEIKRSTPEECVNTVNVLGRAIGNAHRDILYFSSIQGELLSSLKDVCGGSIAMIL